jgi:hypothetical protein
MTATYAIDEAQVRLPALFEEAADHLVCIRDGDRVLGYLVAPQSAEDWEAQVETAEILANPKAIKALDLARDDNAEYHPLTALDD